MRGKEDPPETLNKSLSNEENGYKGGDCHDIEEKLPPPHMAGLPPTESTLLAPPPFQKVIRADNNNNENDENEKVCRICLEDDHPNRMISPCKCKGGSKWVHRECLDEWRANERDRAFSKCTECLFEYHMQPKHRDRAIWRRKAHFYMKVSRDICIVTILSQLVIAILGGLVYLFDINEQSIPQLVNNGQNPIAAYYLFGWLILLVILGIYGSCSLCQNGCSPSAAVGNLGRLEPDEDATYRNRGAVYRRRRHRHDECCCGCYGGSYYDPYPFCYYGDPSCCCCCSDGGSGNVHHDHGCCGDCCNGCLGGGGGGGGDVESCLIVFLIVVAVFMAIIGFLVGLVITVVVFQRIVQRHVYLLHKRQLAQEFQVKDLSAYDLDQPLNPSAPPAELDLQQHPNPSAPPSYLGLEVQQDDEPDIKVDASAPQPSSPTTNSTLQEKDAMYLKKLGLLE